MKKFPDDAVCRNLVERATQWREECGFLTLVKRNNQRSDHSLSDDNYMQILGKVLPTWRLDSTSEASEKTLLGIA